MLKIRPGDLIRIEPGTLVGGGEYDNSDVFPDWDSEGENGIVMSVRQRESTLYDSKYIIACLFQRGTGWVYNDEVEEVLSSPEDAHRGE